MRSIFFLLLFSASVSLAEDPASTPVTASAASPTFTSELAGVGQSKICPKSQPAAGDDRYQELIESAKQGLKDTEGSQ